MKISPSSPSYTCIHTHACMHTHSHMHKQTHVRTHACTRTHVCTHACMHTHLHSVKLFSRSYILHCSLSYSPMPLSQVDCKDALQAYNYVTAPAYMWLVHGLSLYSYFGCKNCFHNTQISANVYSVWLPKKVGNFRRYKVALIK